MEEILKLKEKLGSKLYNRAVGTDSSPVVENKSVKRKKGIWTYIKGHCIKWEGVII